jgi:hypothetical protein
MELHVIYGCRVPEGVEPGHLVLLCLPDPAHSELSCREINNFSDIGNFIFKKETDEWCNISAILFFFALYVCRDKKILYLQPDCAKK